MPTDVRKAVGIYFYFFLKKTSPFHNNIIISCKCSGFTVAQFNTVYSVECVINKKIICFYSRQRLQNAMRLKLYYNDVLEHAVMVYFRKTNTVGRRSSERFHIIDR